MEQVSYVTLFSLFNDIGETASSNAHDLVSSQENRISRLNEELVSLKLQSNDAAKSLDDAINRSNAG